MPTKPSQFKPLFLADWERVLFIHFQVSADQLQPRVPFDLDVRQGHAYVSLVAFTMKRFRPVFGGGFMELLFKPFGNHAFFNIRTYVRHRGEPGIYFLKEYVAKRLNVPLGRTTYGLPYSFGDLSYDHGHEQGIISGRVTRRKDKRCFSYQASITPTAKYTECRPGSLDEFLLERYTAFTFCRNKRRCFQIRHDPWPQASLQVEICDEALLKTETFWTDKACYAGANYSPGLKNIRLGRPRRLLKRENNSPIDSINSLQS